MLYSTLLNHGGTEIYLKYYTKTLSQNKRTITLNEKTGGGGVIVHGGRETIHYIVGVMPVTIHTLHSFFSDL